MRTALAIALASLALATGVHGAAHTQCQDGSAVTGGVKLGKRESRRCMIVAQDPIAALLLLRVGAWVHGARAAPAPAQGCSAGLQDAWGQGETCRIV